MDNKTLTNRRGKKSVYVSMILDLCRHGTRNENGRVTSLWGQIRESVNNHDNDNRQRSSSLKWQRHKPWVRKGESLLLCVLWEQGLWSSVGATSALNCRAMSLTPDLTLNMHTEGSVVTSSWAYIFLALPSEPYVESVMGVTVPEWGDCLMTFLIVTTKAAGRKRQCPRTIPFVTPD